MDYDRWQHQASILSLPSNDDNNNNNNSMSSLPKPDASSSTSSNNNASSSAASLLDPPNVSRYKHDMEQAHAMRRRLRSNNNNNSDTLDQQQQQQQQQLDENIRLGLQALDQADQLVNNINNNKKTRDSKIQQQHDLERAFQLYQMAIELLLRCIKSPHLQRNNNSNNNSNNNNSYDAEGLSARLQVALSDAERIKQQLQVFNNNNNNSNKHNKKQQMPFESTQELSSSSSSWQYLVSALSNALTVMGSAGAGAGAGGIGGSTSLTTSSSSSPPSSSSLPQQQRPTSLVSSSSTSSSSSAKNSPTSASSPRQQQQQRSASARTLGSVVNQGRRPTNKGTAAAAASTSPRQAAEDLVASLSSSQQQQRQNSVTHRNNRHAPPSLENHASSSSFYDTNDPLVQVVKTELYVNQNQLSPTTFADISGLDVAKRSLQESAMLPLLRPDLFTGLRQPHNVLLYGPPGTGKTLLVRAVAYQSRCLLFACSASTLTSKWLGEGEKLVKTLFRVARDVAPSLVFLDELDALLSNRKSDGHEHEASRRFKTEFMIQMDGIRNTTNANTNTSTNITNTNATNKSTLVLVVGCTNCPWDVDAAVLRRFPKRIYIPLPDAEARRGLIVQLLQKAGPHTLTSSRDVTWLVQQTAGYSGSDLTALASEASFGPLRSLSVDAICDTPAHLIRPIAKCDFEQALRVTSKSVPPQLLQKYQEWEQQQQQQQ